MELKLTGIAQDRSKNHIGETTTDKGVHVGFFFFFFFIENSLEVGIVFPIQIAVTLKLQHSRKGHHL